MPRTIDQIKSPTGVLKLGLTALAVDQDVSCQFTRARLVTTTNTEDVPETGCAPATQIIKASSYALELNFLQDVSDPDGIIRWSWENDTNEAFFEFSPFGTGPGTVLIKGKTRVAALPIGGDVGPVLTTDTVTWPVTEKPEITDATTWPRPAKTRGRRTGGGVSGSASDTLRPTRGSWAAGVASGHDQHGPSPQSGGPGRRRAAVDLEAGPGSAPHPAAGVRHHPPVRLERPAPLQGVPVGPWVWATDGTGPHLIGTGAGGGATRPTSTSAGKADRPGAAPRRRRRGAWDAVLERADRWCPSCTTGRSRGCCVAKSNQIRLDVTAQDSASRVLDKVANDAEALERLDPKVVIDSADNASADIDKVIARTRALDGDTARVILEAQADKAQREVDALTLALGRVDGETATATLTARDMATADVERLQAELRDLDGKNVRFRVDAQGLDQIEETLGNLPGNIGGAASALRGMGPAPRGWPPGSPPPPSEPRSWPTTSRNRPARCRSWPA